MSLKIARPIAAACSLLSAIASAGAQQASSSPATPAVSVSGLLFGNYQYVTGGPHRDMNQFVLDRAYLTVRAPAGERLSIRLTTDVHRTPPPDDNGYAIRAKYAYLQYELPRNRAFDANVRAGMLQNVVIEHTDRIWLRFLGTSAIERHSGLASADVGIAKEMQLGDRLGEAYFTIVNGPGYTKRETDRFKDFAGRLTLTPFGRQSGTISTLALTGWTYQGAYGSRFAAGGTDQIAPVPEAMVRDRSGAQLSLRHPRLTALVEQAWFRTQVENGSNTVGAPRIVDDVDGSMTSAFGIARAPITVGGRQPFGAVARYDRVRHHRGADDRYHFFIAGLLYDLASRATLSANYQEQLPERGALPSGLAHYKGWFLHAAVNF
jgi:hypothetical protein